MQSKRVRSALLVGTLGAALVVSGCSGGGGGAGAGEGEPDGDGVTTLSWWSWTPGQDSVGPYIEAFEEANPDIKLEFKNTTYSDYVNAVKLALTSGEGPDVFGLQEGALTAQFAPLAEDLTPYAEESLGADWAEQVYFAEAMTNEGKQVAIPWSVLSAGNLWYNASLLESVGVEYPTNLEEWKEVCAALEEAGKACLQQGARDAWQNMDLFQTVSNQVAPGAFYDAIKGDAPFDTPETVEAFELYQSLFDEGIIQEGALGVAAYPDSADAFIKQEAGFILFGTWANNYADKSTLEELADQYGDPEIANAVFMPGDFPAMVSGATSGEVFGGPDAGWAMSASSKKKEAAWKLIEFLSMTPEGQAVVASEQRPPALASVEMDLSDVVTDEQKAAIEAQSAKLESYLGSREVQDPDVKQALSDALSAVAAGTQSPADAAAAVQAVIDSK
jgi:raffinose/stachyose/melibiose transport system substrate-binding protein